MRAAIHRGPWEGWRPSLSLSTPIEIPSLTLADMLLVAAASLPAAAVLPSPSSSFPLHGLGSPPSWRLVLLACFLRSAALFVLLSIGRRFQKLRAALVASEESAAVEGSRFMRVVPGVVLHYLLMPPAQSPSSGPPRLLMHFNHGFGANAWTFDPLFQSLSASLSKQAPRTALWLTAHDRVGFGLTSRPNELRKYADEPGASYGVQLLESLEPIVAGPPPSPTQVGLEPQQPLSPSRVAESPPPATTPTVLVGHSLGGALSARMVAQLSEGGRASHIRALVLIAPAIICTRPAADSADSRLGDVAPRAASEERTASERSNSKDSASAPVFQRRWLGSSVAASFSSKLRFLAWVASWPIRRVSRTLAVVSVQMGVRCIIHSPRFWRKGLSMAYCDPTKLTPEMVSRYRWPAKVRTADAGVARFTVAQVLSTIGSAMRRSAPSGTRARGDGESEGSRRTEEALMASRRSDGELIEQLRDLRVPVLLVHGVEDAIVPIANSRRLAERLGCPLVELPRCGLQPPQ